MGDSNSHSLTMIRTALLLPQFIIASQACNMLGFKYVPPAVSRVQVLSGTSSSSTTNDNRQTTCMPCNRGIGLADSASPKFLWGTTAATSVPCCTSTLSNATACGVATTRIVGGVDA